MLKIVRKYTFSKHTRDIENVNLQKLVPKITDYRIDTLFVTTRRTCALCSQYNRKVYSVCGWDPSYPKLPSFLKHNCCPECGGSFGFCFYFPGINSEVND